MSAGLADAKILDEADPLRDFRRRFALPAGVIYLDGNSLGALPAATAPRLARAVETEWGEGLIRSWNDAGWIGAPARVGAKIARLIGAAAHEVIVADSTSVNIFKLLAAAARARPGRRVILTETGNFPTDLYVAAGAADALGLELRAVAPGAVMGALDSDVACVLLTHVHYKTAARRDMAAVTAKVHAAGALMIWDLSHSAGAVEVDLRGCGADLAVGCGYKFLNGGPGAPAFLFVAEALLASLASPLTGWMGHAAPFDFSDDWRPAAGVGRFLCGTPPILGLIALESAIDLWLEADRPAVWKKAARLWDLFADAARPLVECHGFELLTPAAAERRGSHIAFTHPNGYAVMHALIARGVIGDFREPDVLRFGLTPLYLSHQDVWRGARTLYEVMESGAWRDAPARAEGRVT
ncbi:MAG TPA: kynureninase [Caulobacteraceae bacterium]|nr:kynureninase [Caulobacteraceae bacterium]